MAKLMRNGQAGDLVELQMSSNIRERGKEAEKTEKIEEARINKQQVEYFGELGNFGEFEGGLMSDDSGYRGSGILTSKDDVLKHLRDSNFKRSSLGDEQPTSACQQCVVV
jgi:hypothetical protein